MNPISALLLLAFAVGATFAPWRRREGTTPARALLLEAGALALAVVLAWLARDLVRSTRAGIFWGRVGVFAAAYWYVCAGGAVLVRRVLDLVPVGESPAPGGIAVPESELSRGVMIGVLERAITLTLVLIGQFGALGLVIAAKALTRFRALDDRDFAEYVLIGTLASLLFALFTGIAVRFAMFWG
jgi:hypothetical protein